MRKDETLKLADMEREREGERGSFCCWFEKVVFGIAPSLIDGSQKLQLRTDL